MAAGNCRDIRVVVIFSHDAFFQRYGGVSRCVVELMRHLDGQAQSWRVIAGRYGSRFLKDLQDGGAGGVVGTWREKAPGRISAAARNEPGFARMIAATPSVVVHRSYYPVIDLLPPTIPVVVTLHDMHWEAPGTPRSLRHRMHSWLKRRALVRANRIVCISQFTLDELTRAWPDLAGKAEVIHHGVSPLAAPSAGASVESDRFIFVGDRSTRKNFAAALAGLAESGLDGHELLCIGGGDFSVAERHLIEDHGLTGRVVQRAADDEALATCYASSTALLYPSTYEGFGMPLLEAMLYGCPVIASRASSLPEVGGQAALYANPHDPREWAASMRDVVEPAIRSRLIAQGRKQAREFSWDDVARHYASVYRRVAEASGQR